MYLVILLPLGMLVCGPPTNCGKVLDCPRCGGLFGEGFLGFSRLVCRWVVTCSWRVVYGIALGRDIGVNYGNIGCVDGDWEEDTMLGLLFFF